MCICTYIQYIIIWYVMCIYRICILYIHISTCSLWWSSEVFGQILWSVALFGNTGEVQVSPYFVLHTPGKTQDIARLGTYKLAVSFHSRILVSEALKKLAKSQHSCGVTNRHNRLHFWPLATPWVAHVTLGWSAGNGSAKSAKCPAWATALEAQRGDDKTGTILHIDHIVEDYMRLYMIMYFPYIWIYMDIYIYMRLYMRLYIYIWDYTVYYEIIDYIVYYEIIGDPL